MQIDTSRIDTVQIGHDHGWYRVVNGSFEVIRVNWPVVDYTPTGPMYLFRFLGVPTGLSDKYATVYQGPLSAIVTFTYKEEK